MKKMKAVFFLSTLLLFASSAWAIQRECCTREYCDINKKTECTVTPSSAYNRYFYFLFTHIEQGKIYSCHFSSKPETCIILINHCIFPSGSKYKITSSSFPIFPIDLILDTHDMLTQSGMMVIKYMVPASDIPSEMTAHCIENDI